MWYNKYRAKSYVMSRLAAQRAVAPGMSHRTRVMWIENKSEGLTGPARVGPVSYSNTGASLYYGVRTFKSLKGRGFTANYVDAESGEEYWISGCHRDDMDVLEEYWTGIRRCPDLRHVRTLKVAGKNY